MAENDVLENVQPLRPIWNLLKVFRVKKEIKPRALSCCYEML
jgi:hypothetical protein